MKQMQQAVNAARYQRKLKHIRKVKAAIRYQEAAQRQRHIAGKKKKEIRDYARSIQLAENVKYSAAKEAAKGSKQDWRLGQLRPNRAIGSGAERYGVFPQEWNRLMELPEEWRDGRLFKENKGKTKKVPEYLLSEHLLMPHWPIVEGDRVVVIRGVHRNKIGTVERVDARRNTITISGITVGHGSFTHIKHS